MCNKLMYTHTCTHTHVHVHNYVSINIICLCKEVEKRGSKRRRRRGRGRRRSRMSYKMTIKEADVSLSKQLVSFLWDWLVGVSRMELVHKPAKQVKCLLLLSCLPHMLHVCQCDLGTGGGAGAGEGERRWY